jgi:hypothetical protein
LIRSMAALRWSKSQLLLPASVYVGLSENWVPMQMDYHHVSL